MLAPLRLCREFTETSQRERAANDRVSSHTSRRPWLASQRSRRHKRPRAFQSWCSFAKNGANIPVVIQRCANLDAVVTGEMGRDDVVPRTYDPLRALGLVAEVKGGAHAALEADDARAPDRQPAGVARRSCLRQCVSEGFRQAGSRIDGLTVVEHFAWIDGGVDVWIVVRLEEDELAEVLY